MNTARKPPPTPLISIDRIAVRLRDRWLLNGLSWQINIGEQWLVVGPNGAGKTTLAKAIAGLLPVVQGKIDYESFDGISPADAIAYVDSDARRALWQRELRLDHARAYAGRYTESTRVRDLLYQHFSFHHSPVHGDAPMIDVVRTLDLHHLLDKPAMAISTGEMSRLLVARELVRNPKMLILDEPFDGLDPKSREQVKIMFQKLADKGLPMIFITHHGDEVLDATTHRLVIDDGRVVSIGPIQRTSSSTKSLSKIASGKKIHHTSKPGQGPHRPPARVHSSEPLIDMAAVTVRYGDTVVLDRLSWCVNPGEHWAVTGPNGAGKSTLLKLITGDCLQVFANRVRLFGQNRGAHQTLWEIRGHLGVVSHDLAMGYQKSLTALDVVCSGFFDSVGLYRKCDDRQVKMAKGWLAKLDTAGLSSTLFDHLSRGQRQAVLIARAMVKSPRLLLLDEPCAGLDGKTWKIVLQIVEKIGREEGTGLIYISHRKEQIPQCTTHHLALDRGRVVYCGSVGAHS